jgi:hypothetical protein
MNKRILAIASGGIAFVAVTGAVFADTNSSTPKAVPDIKQAHQDQHQLHHGQYKNQELLTLLKTDAATLQQDLKSGKSLADIAVAHGKTEQDIINLLVTQETQRIDKAVTNGKLTQEKANQIKAKLPAQIKNRVEHKGLFGVKRGGKHKGNKGQFKEIASIIGADQKEVMTKIRAGESLVQIAKDHKITEQDLIDKLLQKDKERITKMVEKKWQKHDKSNKQTNTQLPVSTN